ncbi:hypothetical protein FB451DRAFT_1239934 [Mycena latifolia]|nr:hypothetical protein FB451DRAFT_1239934 [Mycena latifolia]
MYPKVIQTLPQSMAMAEGLRTFCAMTPDMSSYQPIAASAFEVCAAAASTKTHTTEKIAVYVVDRTTLLINTMAPVPISPNMHQSLEAFEQKLDAIRRHIEQMPIRTGKKTKLILRYKIKQETRRLKAELESHLYDLLAMSSTPSLGPSRSDCALEVVALSTRAAGAICEAPVLNFLKPVVGIAALICDTVKSVKSNHDAAIDLAKHASITMRCIVERASAINGASANDGAALEVLKLTLEDIQLYLAFLGKRRRRLAPWIFANQDKDRFVQLNDALDKALAMFSATKTLSTAADVRAATGQIGVLLSTVQRMDSTLTMVHAKFAEATFPRPRAPKDHEGHPYPGCARADSSGFGPSATVLSSWNVQQQSALAKYIHPAGFFL